MNRKIKLFDVLIVMLLPLFLAGCGSSSNGTNSELDAVHIGGQDCAQRGCHPGFGAGGTIFMNLSSSMAMSGVPVAAQSISTGTVLALGTSDSLGNFHYVDSLNGYYSMAVNGKPWSRPHTMPDWNGCNRCHMWPPTGGAPGKLN